MPRFGQCQVLDSHYEPYEESKGASGTQEEHIFGRWIGVDCEVRIRK
jgi:hypothetical protein